MNILSFISSFVFSFALTHPFLPGRPAFPSPARIFTPPPKHLEKAERGRMPLAAMAESQPTRCGYTLRVHHQRGWRGSPLRTPEIQKRKRHEREQRKAQCVDKNASHPRRKKAHREQGIRARADRYRLPPAASSRLSAEAIAFGKRTHPPACPHRIEHESDSTLGQYL